MVEMKSELSKFRYGYKIKSIFNFVFIKIKILFKIKNELSASEPLKLIWRIWIKMKDPLLIFVESIKSEPKMVIISNNLKYQVNWGKWWFFWANFFGRKKDLTMKEGRGEKIWWCGMSSKLDEVDKDIYLTCYASYLTNLTIKINWMTEVQHWYTLQSSRIKLILKILPG